MNLFWEKVFKTPTCWIWGGSLNTNGYGIFKRSSPLRLAHRASWILTNGDIPKGLFVLHKCDVRNCVNPDHLFLGTYSDNTKDAIEKGRHYNPYRNKTHCKRGHEFTEENTFRKPEDNARVCKICRRFRNARHRNLARKLASSSVG